MVGTVLATLKVQSSLGTSDYRTRSKDSQEAQRPMRCTMSAPEKGRQPNAEPCQLQLDVAQPQCVLTSSEKTTWKLMSR